MQNELYKIKDIVINKIVIMSAIFFIPPYAISLLRWFEIGWHYIYAIHSTVYFAILGLAIFRNKFNYYQKTIIITILYLIISLFGLINFALNGGFYYVIISMAILAILANKKLAIYINIIIILIFSIVAIAYSTNYLNTSVDLNLLAHSPYQWSLTLFSIFSITLIFIYGFADFYQKLSETITEKENYATELLHKKELLELAEKKYRMLFEGANDAIIILKDGYFKECNDKACEYFLTNKKELIGKNIEELSPKHQHNGQESSKKASKYYELVLNDNPQQFEWQYKKSNGEYFDVSISLNKINLQGINCVQGILRDITDKKNKDIELENYKNNLEVLVEEKTKKLEAVNKKLNNINIELTEKNDYINSQNIELKETLKHLKKTQTQLLQSEKMASLGILTAGIAHEINNPLNFILGAYEGLKQLHKKETIDCKDKKTEIYLSALKNGVERTTAIVNGLNQFSRNSKSYMEDCNINTIIENTLVLLNTKFKNRIKIDKQFTDETVFLKGNIGELHQVFINILSNSIDAITGSGAIKIKTFTENEKIIIEILDSGCGIQKDNLDKITDPFYTTKDPGKGAGLGLSICYNIIKKHKGKLEFESEINKGTLSRIVLSLKKN